MRALWIIVGFECRRMLFGPRGVLTLVTLGVSLLPILPVEKLLEELITLKRDPMASEPLAPAYGLISDWTELPREQIATLFADYPPHLIAYFAGFLWTVPVLVYICGYDQTATDMRLKHMRFLLLRVDRATLLMGRSLAVLVSLAAIYALAIVGLVAVLSTFEDGLGGVTGILYLGRVWLSALLLSLPLIALLSWANALTASPRLSLAMVFGLQMGLLIVSEIWDDVSVLMDAYLLFPTAYKYNLLSDDGAFLQVALGHQLGLTLLFAGLAWLAFRRRDA